MSNYRAPDSESNAEETQGKSQKYFTHEFILAPCEPEPSMPGMTYMDGGTQSPSPSRLTSWRKGTTVIHPIARPDDELIRTWVEQLLRPELGTSISREITALIPQAVLEKIRALKDRKSCK